MGGAGRKAETQRHPDAQTQRGVKAARTDRIVMRGDREFEAEAQRRPNAHTPTRPERREGKHNAAETLTCSGVETLRRSLLSQGSRDAETLGH